MTELLPPHRPVHRRARRRHRRGRPRDRLPVRPVQAHPQRVRRRAHRQGPQLGRLADPSRGDRLRRRLLRRRDARHARRDPRGQDLPRLRLAATSPSTRSRRSSTSAASPSPARDSGGFIYDEAGIDREKLAFVMELKNVKRGRISEYADKFKSAVVHRRSTQAKDFNPLWDHQGRLRLPVRHAERDQRQGRREPAEERRLRGLRGRQHADRPRGRRAVRREGHPLRPRQGRQRRRRGHLRPRDVAEQPAPRAGRARKSTPACTAS